MKATLACHRSPLKSGALCQPSTPNHTILKAHWQPSRIPTMPTPACLYQGGQVSVTWGREVNKVLFETVVSARVQLSPQLSTIALQSHPSFPEHSLNCSIRVCRKGLHLQPLRDQFVGGSRAGSPVLTCHCSEGIEGCGSPTLWEVWLSELRTARWLHTGHSTDSILSDAVYRSRQSSSLRPWTRKRASLTSAYPHSFKNCVGGSRLLSPFPSSPSCCR